MAYTRLSQRKYAELLGVSNTAVSKAIQNKKIVKGWDAVNKEIIVEKANLEWGNLQKSIDVKDLLQDDGESERPQKGGLLSYAEARRFRENCSAKLAEMDVKERTGELVRKEDVRQVLFQYGQTIRTNLLAIPDRNIDNILAAKTRAEAHGILYNAIADCLIELTTKRELNVQAR